MLRLFAKDPPSHVGTRESTPAACNRHSAFYDGAEP